MISANKLTHATNDIRAARRNTSTESRQSRNHRRQPMVVLQSLKLEVAVFTGTGECNKAVYPITSSRSLTEFRHRTLCVYINKRIGPNPLCTNKTTEIIKSINNNNNNNTSTPRTISNN